MKNINLLKKSKHFYQLPFKNLYITTRGRPSRDGRDISDPKGNIPDIIYYKQMKEFIKEAQGVPPQSQKWFQIRNKHYKILHDKTKDTSEKLKQSLDTQYLRFYVLIIPEQTLSYELVSILNFYQIRYKALEDSPVSRSIMKQMLGSTFGVGSLYRSISNGTRAGNANYKSFEFPFLIFETSEEAPRTFEGFENILEFLIENNFIHDYRSHTVYEKEGVEFCDNFESNMNNLMKKFSNRFSFYFRGTNFKEARYWYNPFKDGYVYRNRILSRIYRMMKDILGDAKFYLSGKKKKNQFFLENENKLKQEIRTWVDRLNGKPFHGGDVPDAADFRLYSIFRKYSNCRKLNFWLKNLVDGSEDSKAFWAFDDWNSRMFILCSRDNFYNIRDVGYNYNRFISEDILEDQKINKPLHETQDKGKEVDDFEGELGIRKQPKTKSAPIMGVFGNKIRRSKINI